MRVTWRRVVAGILVLGLALFLYSALFGRLVLFSPIVAGFRHQDTERARLYYHAGADLALFRDIDRIVESVEASHRMKYTRRVEVFVCDSDAEHRRIAGTQARFCALPLYGRLSVSKRAQEEAAAGKIHLDTYVEHELSHSLLFQHTTLWRSLFLPDWLLEGLAVLNARQMGVDGYLSPEEVRDRMKQGYFLAPADFMVKPWKTSEALQQLDLPDKYYFAYSEMACFVRDLISTSGEEAFDRFLRGMLDGASEETLFQSAFGRSFADSVQDFKARMMAGQNEESAAGKR